MTLRVGRGGSWYSYIWYVRVEAAFAYRPEGRRDGIGLRIVKEDR